MTKLSKKARRELLGTPVRRNARCLHCARGPRLLYPITLQGRRVGEGCEDCLIGFVTGFVPFRRPPAAPEGDR